MPSLAHSIILAALYVVVLPSSPFVPMQALASPLPLMAADYSHNNNATAAHKSTSRTKDSFAHNHTHPFPMAAPVLSRDDVDGFDLLTSFYTTANSHATNLKALAVRSSTVGDNDYNFQHDCAHELTGFQTNLLGFQSKLGDKGLGYYDRSNDLETLLKNVVNLNKDVLTSIDILVYNLPILGPILGPIVYEIKCILDQVLNLCEDLTDAIANIVLPLLRPVILLASARCDVLCR